MTLEQADEEIARLRAILRGTSTTTDVAILWDARSSAYVLRNVVDLSDGGWLIDYCAQTWPGMVKVALSRGWRVAAIYPADRDLRSYLRMADGVQVTCARCTVGYHGECEQPCRCSHE